MNKLSENIRIDASRAAALCVYSYLWNARQPKRGEGLSESLVNIRSIAHLLSQRESDLLSFLEEVAGYDALLLQYKAVDGYFSDGLCVCAFEDPEGDITVVFRGTGKEEWIDNGEGLSGLPFKNTYYRYGRDGETDGKITKIDYATASQAEALNWFNMAASKNGWAEERRITVAGHSKGGNKAQFVSLFSPLADTCLSFDGQGFSPEAVSYFREELGEIFSERRKKIKSLSAYNDYINVLGDRVCENGDVFFFEAPLGDENPVAYHFPEAILDSMGRLRKEREQGQISGYIEDVYEKISKMPPKVRSFATLGVASVGERITGGQTYPKKVTALKTAKGLVIATAPIISSLFATNNPGGIIEEAVKNLSGGLSERLEELFDSIGRQFGREAEAGSLLLSCAALAYARPLVETCNVGDISLCKGDLQKKLKAVDHEVYTLAEGIFV